LDHLSNQTLIPNEIILVASGMDIKSITEKFSNKLNINYIHSKIAGQIHQRNLGKKEVNKNADYIVFLDDDIILNNDAFEKMMAYWETKDENTAGIGFNLIYQNSHEDTFLFKLLKILNSAQAGNVMKSGLPISINNLSQNIETQFLGGGYTVWRKKIIDEYKQDSLKTNWAQGEDLRFSYPIGKKYKLFVCATATGRELEFDNENISSTFSHGKIQGLTDLYFTTLHKELSTVRAYCLLTIKSFINIISIKSAMHGFGQLKALYIFIKSKVLSRNLLIYINN
jgi:glycosyltransferase involved in cell wall biosynthesis